MTSGFFEYPKQAYFGRKLPKTKIYEKARITARLRKKIVEEIDRIEWAYKLSPETVNLAATASVPEIEVFIVTLKVKDISSDVVRAIDNAIPRPVIYEIVAGDKTKVMAAYKRPSEGDASKWVTDIYFETKWSKADTKRHALPVALDLGLLYEQMLRSLMPVSRIEREDLRGQVERLTKIRSLESQTARLESRMRKEKQFNRKVELNAELRRIKTTIENLLDHAN